MIKIQGGVLQLIIYQLLLLCTYQKISGKEFASSLLDVLNDIRLKPYEYISYLEDHFKILKKNVFLGDNTNESSELDNNEILLRVDSEIQNLESFLEKVNKLDPLNKNKFLTRAAQKIAKSNAKKSTLKYQIEKWEKESKELPKSKIILERQKQISGLDIIKKEASNVVSEVYQITGKFHLSFRNMLNCLLMFLSTANSESDLAAKRNLLFFQNKREQGQGAEDKVLDTDGMGFGFFGNYIDKELQIGIGVQLENQNFYISILMAYVLKSG
jgi:hypothetical protein